MHKRREISHEVLNAKYHEKEAEIIAKAGQKKAVTIATNMAGRGTDIVLGEGVVDLGGLHVLGTERHESRRIDNQLRGRSGRQGDIGSSQFYLSTSDDLLRLFGSEKIFSIMETFNFPEDLPIQHPMITRSIENAQRQVESRNFEIRKHVLEYDDVMNKQREVIYTRRKNILEEEDLKANAGKIMADVIATGVDLHLNPGDYPEKWNLEDLASYMNALIPKEKITEIFDRDRFVSERWDMAKLKERLTQEAANFYTEREDQYSPPVIRKLETMVMLNVIDNMWRGHLLEMDYLKEGIGLRAIGQRDPLVEFKREAFHLFKELIEEIRYDTAKLLLNAKIISKEEQDRAEARSSDNIKNLSTSGPAQPVSQADRQKTATSEKSGRNAPCPCGSGKTDKKCSGK